MLERLREQVDDAAADGDLQAIRDAAILRLLYSAGLRRSEVVGLRFPDDVNLENATATLRGTTARARMPPAASDFQGGPCIQQFSVGRLMIVPTGTAVAALLEANPCKAVWEERTAE